jgi:hypothetical protein
MKDAPAPPAPATINPETADKADILEFIVNQQKQVIAALSTLQQAQANIAYCEQTIERRWPKISM